MKNLDLLYVKSNIPRKTFNTVDTKSFSGYALVDIKACIIKKEIKIYSNGGKSVMIITQ